MASKYQYYHHDDVAAVMAGVRGTWEADIRFDGFTNLVLRRTAEALANLFTADNANFDRERFLKACGLED